MPNPLDKLGPSRCNRCNSQPCCCHQPRNPLAGPLCVRCQASPCCCHTRQVQARLCRQCGLNPCRCGESPPCEPLPYDEYAKCPCGYQVGDTLTVVGGTFTVAATLTVTSIQASTGSVLTVSVANGGNYSVQPANPAATTGVNGTGATFTLTFTGTAVTGAALAVGGGPWPQGYRVGDVCQLEGGIFTTPASVVVTATTSGQVAGIAIRTAGSGYSVNPCSPTPTFGGHGCGLKVTAGFTAGVMTSAVVADMGGSCYEPPRQWFERTPINIWSAGSGPPAQPRNTARGLLQPGWCLGQELMVDTCSEDAAQNARPVSYLTLPGSVDINGSCCGNAGDVVELPAKSGRLYNVWWVEYVGLDLPGVSPGPTAQPWPCVEGPTVGGRLLVILTQQCPFLAGQIPDGNFLVADDGVTPLYADDFPNHFLLAQ